MVPSSGKTDHPMLPSISTDGPADLEGSPKCGAQPTDERRGAIFASGADREDDELVSTDACHGVCFTYDRLESACECLQHDVAGTVAPDVVDVLEAVEVDCDEREGLARPL